MAKIAVIDIGTNSIHMVLAEIQPDAGYKILDRFKDMTRLGNGAFTTHRLSDEAITRGLDVIRNLVTLAKNKGYDRIIAVATSAVREAKNGGDFIDLVAEAHRADRPRHQRYRRSQADFPGRQKQRAHDRTADALGGCRRWIGRTDGRES